jgi:hypothetical protein
LNFNDLFFSSLRSVPFCRNRFGILWMRYTVVGTASYGRLFLPITLSEERKNLQEIHFKPPDQARRPTFASDKTKPGLTGDEAGETL